MLWMEVKNTASTFSFSICDRNLAKRVSISAAENIGVCFSPF
jgi:hypothetical protein